jgi:hypothetical protein
MKGQFVVEVENLTHLNRVLGAIANGQGVISVERREQVDACDLRRSGGKAVRFGAHCLPRTWWQLLTRHARLSYHSTERHSAACVSFR